MPRSSKRSAQSGGRRAARKPGVVEKRRTGEVSEVSHRAFERMTEMKERVG